MKQAQIKYAKKLSELNRQIIADCISIENEIMKDTPGIAEIHRKCINLKREARELQLHIAKHNN